MEIRRQILKIFAVALLFNLSALSQTRTNIEVYYSLVDSAAQLIVSRLPGNQNKILLSSPMNDYLLFTNRLKYSIIKKGIAEVAAAETQVNIAFDKASVKYSDMHRKSFLGSMRVVRKVELGGNLSIVGQVQPAEFFFTSTDTIIVDDVKNIENPVYPFTVSDLPAEPFFSSLLEPVVAIGTAAVAIYLFFSVRSK